MKNLGVLFVVALFLAIILSFGDLVKLASKRYILGEETVTIQWLDLPDKSAKCFYIPAVQSVSCFKSK